MIEVALVGQNDKIIGYKEKYELHRNPVALHQAISVVVVKDLPHGRQTLLQRRALNKPTWPGFWTNATCTHPLKGESYHDAASRRLKEEMGIETDLKEIFNFIYEAQYDETWGEHELDHVFLGEYGGKVKLDPNEAMDYKWVGMGWLKRDVEKNPESYTPWFKIIISKLDRWHL
jgi:isopentenyl-diphosphate delta-isomerase